MHEPAELFQEYPESPEIRTNSPFFRKWTCVEKPPLRRRTPSTRVVTISPKARAYRLRRNGRGVIEEPPKAELLEKVP